MSLPPRDLEERILRGHRSGDLTGEREAADLSELLLVNVADGIWSPRGLQGALDAAAECKWDGMYSDPLMVFQAVMAISKWIRFAERHLGLSDPERLQLRATGWIRESRAWHMRGPEYDLQAFAAASGCLTWLENVAGGPDALAEIVARPMENPLAEQAVALLPVYAATLRRTDLKAKATFMRRGCILVRAYALHPRTEKRPAVYPRTAALAAQWLLAVCERGWVEDRALAAALYDLDRETRPLDARGLSTQPLVDFEFAKYMRRLEEAEQYRLAALAKLDPERMPRHFAIIERMGFLKPGL